MNLPRNLAVLLAVVLSLLAAGSGRAATLARLDLAIDGSADPPGDRIDVSLFLGPAEKQATLQLRALEVFGENRPNQRVKARGQRNRDASGSLLVTRDEPRGQRTPLVETSLVVPYEDLDLVQGTHQIAYELTAICAGQVVWVQATELTRVTVSPGVRQTLAQTRPTAPAAVETRRAPVLLGGKTLRGGVGPIDKKWIDVVEARVAGAPIRENVAVSIPGRYDREPMRSRLERPLAVQSTEAYLAVWPKERAWYPLSEVRSNAERTVYFAPLEDEAAKRRDFGKDVAAEISYGSCLVNIPVEHHRKGQLEEPIFVGQRNPADHFLIESIREQTKADFLKSVEPNDVLVFVHGFNNTFASAVLRTAQLQYDLEFPGAAVTFCWPSAGDFNQYQLDSQHAAQSAKALAEVLANLVASSRAREAAGQGAGKIHLLAHSMGNRVLLNALYELHESGALSRDARPFGQVVLAAPDIGAALFNNLLHYATDSAAQVTYYYCKHDSALLASQRLNNYEPVGLLPYFDARLCTINADGTDTSFLGHNYYSSSKQVLLDIQLLVSLGLPPAERMPPLGSRAEVFGHDYWSFTSLAVKQSAAASTPAKPAIPR
jgi:alpha/beta hydrolase family protein DUF900